MRKVWALLFFVMMMLSAACGDSTGSKDSEVPKSEPTPTVAILPDDTPTATPEPEAEVVKETESPTPTSTPVPEPTEAPAPTQAPTPTAVPAAETMPERDLDIVTLLPFDGIPSINNPGFFPDLEKANMFYKDHELVLGVEIDGDARAYSVPLLSSHEIVNDVVGGRPIAVTW